MKVRDRGTGVAHRRVVATLVWATVLLAVALMAHKAYRAAVSPLAAETRLGDVRSAPTTLVLVRERKSSIDPDPTTGDGDTPQPCGLTDTEREILQTWARVASSSAGKLLAAGETWSPLYEMAMDRCDAFRRILAEDAGPDPRPFVPPAPSPGLP